MIRYHLALLGRSQRWLAPTVLYAALLGVGFVQGQSLGDALGFSGLALVPVVAWLTRVVLVAEPAAARACLAAAAGARRAHLAALTAALIAGLALATGGSAAMLVLSHTRTPAVAAAGLLAQAICVLVGTAIGAACNPPLVRRTGYAIPATVFAVIAAIAWNASPAHAAVVGVTGPAAVGHGPAIPLVPAAIALLLTAAAWTLSARAASR